jgi:hypothetical protein
MPLRSLFGGSAETAYATEADMIEFHARVIAITEDLPIAEARRRARTDAEDAYLAALAAGSEPRT